MEDIISLKEEIISVVDDSAVLDDWVLIPERPYVDGI
jgi:hypothetical protein